MKIQVLSSEVVDQIAAGEVVERPSHLVKELIENSLDAGSTEIIIDFAIGGRFVKIIDNGSGISAEDLPKMFLRFATSKIHSVDDLWRLQSFGFRGEALASISSVSQMTVFSSDNESGSGYRLNCQFGKINTPEPVSRSRGTTVIVEELFQNVPARLKFMKSESAEATQIKAVIKAIAISRPDVSFRFLQDNKLLHFWPQKKNWKERIEDVFDVTPLYEGVAVRGSTRCRSFFASPDETAKTSRMIWLFAQGRYVQDRSMQAAVMEAYRNLLMQGEFPIVASFIETAPDQIDVNIHPTKSQVKFLSSQDAFRAVQASIRDVLEKAPWLEVQKNTWGSFTYASASNATAAMDSVVKVSAVNDSSVRDSSTNDSTANDSSTNTSSKNDSTANNNSVNDSTVRDSSGGTTSEEILQRTSQETLSEILHVNSQPKNLQFEDPAFNTTMFRRREFTASNPTQDVVLKLTDFEKIKISNNEISDLGSASLSISKAAVPPEELKQRTVPPEDMKQREMLTKDVNQQEILSSDIIAQVSTVQVGATQLGATQVGTPHSKVTQAELTQAELTQAEQTQAATTSQTITNFEKRKLWSNLEVIGQAGLTYIICQSQKSLVLVDQHAAHERVVFEKLMHSLKNGGLEVQNFLFPLAIDLNEEKMEALKSCEAELAQIGIELEELGPITIGIKSAPVILKDKVVIKEIHRFAQEIVDRGVSFSFEKTIADICASMACHSVVRAGESLSLTEMRKLLEQMDEYPLSCYCPHGRPVSVEMPWTKLEKDFGRIVT